jgi:hypothetical protein
MSFDIRYPIGLMFATVGAVLGGYGLATRGDAMYERSLGVNVNASWGCVLLVFGATMLASAWAASRKKG